MKRKYKIVLVGAGVGSMSAVIKLLKLGFKGDDILMIEMGDDIYNRKSDDYVESFGGSGTFSDFKWLVADPGTNIGGATYKYIEENKVKEIYDEVFDDIKHFHPDPSQIMFSGKKEEPKYIIDSPFELKQSDCYHIGTDYGLEMIKNIYDWFVDKEVNMIFRTKVLDIDFKNQIILSENKDNKEKQSFYFEKCFIAVGKVGIGFFSDLIKKYNINTTSHNMQVGCRFETEYEYFKDLAEINYDFKLYKKFNDDISGRSFCTNNQKAYVANEVYPGLGTGFNGHCYSDISKQNNKTNFGILLEVKGIEEPFEKTKEIVNKCNTQDKKGKIVKVGNCTPSLNEGYKEVNIDEFKQDMSEYSEYILNFIDDLKTTFPKMDSYNIYYPEFKLLSRSVIINNNDLSIEGYPNIHIAGDINGCRGLFCTQIQSYYVAEKLNEYFK